MEIKVLGTGCSKCKILHERVLSVTKDMDVNVEYINDIEKMLEYGVMSVPALVVNGKIESAGLIKEEKILTIIKGC